MKTDQCVIRMQKHIEAFKELARTNPEEATKQAKESLERMGILKDGKIVNLIEHPHCLTDRETVEKYGLEGKTE